MVLVTPAPIHKPEEIRELDIPVINLLEKKSEVSEQIVKACEEFGFFKVINHGVPMNVIKKMEDESFEFLSKSLPEKQVVGPPNPCGYGVKNIGFNGDGGELEYLLLHVNSSHISHVSKLVSSSDPIKFSSAVGNYVEAVRELGCQILENMAEGLGASDTSVFSQLIRAVDCDSLLRFNHYPPQINSSDNKTGFGEHSDPQILTLLRSNTTPGLQISLEEGVWVPIPSDPTSFYVNLDDLLQVMTNRRFESLRHRAIVDNSSSRLSMGYFCGPPLDTNITSLPELTTAQSPSVYRPFTWAEYKKTAYSLRLRDTRLSFYKVDPDS